MPNPINESTIKLIWENNPDTPITSSTLSKSVDVIASYRDFDVSTHKEGTILIKDPIANRLIMKREVIVGLINKESVVPINQQYKLFDNGLEDLYIRVEDQDSSPSNPQPNKTSWGQDLEWFVYICDTENGISGQILVSKSREFPYGQILGRTSSYYSKNNTRMIGGFKTNSSSIIIDSSVWDISGKHNTISAKNYKILDEFGLDSLDSNRHVYRGVRISDLDTMSTSNTFNNDIIIKSNLIVRPNVDNLLYFNVLENSLTVSGTIYGNVTGNITGNISGNSGTVSNGVYTNTAQQITGKKQFVVDATIAAVDSAASLEVTSTASNASSGPVGIAFHRQGAWGSKLCLGLDNRFHLGGFSDAQDGGKLNLGEINIAGANFYVGATEPTGTTRVNCNGYFYATRVYNAVYNDLAEFFLSIDEKQVNKVYVLCEKCGKLKISKKRADKNVVGVCSDTFAFVMKQELEESDGVPIALAGTVKVSVKTKIKIGDELVSDKQGYAVSANFLEKIFKRSSIIGKAIEKNNNEENTILMLVK